MLVALLLAESIAGALPSEPDGLLESFSQLCQASTLVQSDIVSKATAAGWVYPTAPDGRPIRKLPRELPSPEGLRRTDSSVLQRQNGTVTQVLMVEAYASLDQPGLRATACTVADQAGWRERLGKLLAKRFQVSNGYVRGDHAVFFGLRDGLNGRRELDLEKTHSHEGGERIVSAEPFDTSTKNFAGTKLRIIQYGH